MRYTAKLSGLKALNRCLYWPWPIKSLNLNLIPHLLPYHVGKGGIFLKDAAVLSGLSIIGMNNLLITPEFGPRVRLRALCLDVEVEPTGPVDFAPCETCDMPCRQACPEESFKNGAYKRVLCK